MAKVGLASGLLQKVDTKEDYQHLVFQLLGGIFLPDLVKQVETLYLLDLDTLATTKLKFSLLYLQGHGMYL